MFELVKKDFLIGKYYLLGLLLLIPFVSSLGLIMMIEYFGGIELGIFVLLTVILCLFSSLIFINIDASSRADELLLSLPIKRSVIVYSRYITSFLMAGFGLLLIYLTCLIFGHIVRVQDQYLDIILNYHGMILISVLVSMVLLAVLPLFIKYGGGKGSGVAFFSIAFILLLPALSKLIMKAFKGKISFDFSVLFRLVDTLVIWLADLSQLVLYLLLIGIIAVSLIISSRLSISFYKKRNI